MALIPCVIQGVPASNQKSYAYDEAQYIQTDLADFVLGATTLASNGIPSFTTKQLKSITVVPTTAETAADFIQLDLYTAYAQVFGTATASAIVQGSGTVLGTSYNRVRITGILAVGTALGGTAIGGATGTQAFGLGTAQLYNPTYVAIAGATATMTVAGAAGTNVQAGYVFPTGVQGGLTMQPGDVLVVSRGTSSVGVYAIECEFTFTPGGYVTR